MPRRNYSSDLAVNDLLFNVLLGFICLFVLAFLLINPVAKKGDIPYRAEFMVIVEWDDLSSSDVDVWMAGPDNIPVGFKNRDGQFMTLDRDDLGATSDTVEIEGQEISTKINREVVTVRSVIPGKYYINIHLYRKSYDDKEPLPITITVIDVNPYSEAYTKRIYLNDTGDVATLPGFSVNSKGSIEFVFNSDNVVIPLQE